MTLASQPFSSLGPHNSLPSQAGTRQADPLLPRTSCFRARPSSSQEKTCLSQRTFPLCSTQRHWRKCDLPVLMREKWDQTWDMEGLCRQSLPLFCTPAVSVQSAAESLSVVLGTKANWLAKVKSLGLGRTGIAPASSCWSR